MTNPAKQLNTAIAFLGHRPLLPIVGFFIGGILLARALPWSFWVGLSMAGIGGVLAVAGRMKNTRRFTAVALVCACVGIGFALMARSERPVLPPGHIANFTDRGKLDLQGRIVKPVRIFTDRTLATVRVEKIHLPHGSYMPTEGLIQLSGSFTDPPFEYGSEIRFSARLRKIHSLGTPGVFDHAQYLRHRGIFVAARIKKPEAIQVVDKKGGWTPRRAVESARGRIRTFLKNNLPSPQNQIVSALVLGEKERLPEAVTQTFRKGGIAHLLAISGMHIGSIFGLVFLLVARLLRFSAWFCRRFEVYKAATLIALVPAFAYAELAGWRISTTRAFLMVAIYAVAVLIGRRKHLLSALAFAALVILAIWPFCFFEPGFQLSFAAVFAIVIVAPRILRVLSNPSELDRLEQAKRPVAGALSWLVASAASSLAATLTVWPITAYHFGHISPFAVFTNLFMVPLYTLLVVPVLLLGTVLIPLWTTGANVLFAFGVKAIDLGYFLTGLVAGLPGSLIWLWRPTLPEILAFYTLIAALILPIRRVAWLLAAASALVLVGSPLVDTLGKLHRKELTVTVIDVGQGLAQLIEFPKGETWLVDGGGTRSEGFDVGERVLGPFLRAKRIRTLDRVINTHPHPDHFAGLLHILETFNVKAVTLSPMDNPEDDRYDRFSQMAAPLSSGPLGQSTSEPGLIQVNDVTVAWLHPPAAAFDPKIAMSRWSANDLSLVLKLSLGDCSILLPADIEQHAEDFLVESGADLQADVLISPHHGSRTSSSNEFLAAVHPQHVIISAGKHNWYGHPAAQVLDRYRLFKAGIFSTGEDGTTTATCTETSLEINTYRKVTPSEF